MDNYVDDHMYICAGDDGVLREYDASLDFTINFENEEAMNDFEEWLMNGGGNEAFISWRKARKLIKEKNEVQT